MAPRISSRKDVMPSSPIRKLSVYAEAAKKRGTHVYHVNIGQPDLPTPEPMLQAVRGYSDEVVAYTPSNGDPEYREALKEYYARNDIPLEDSQFIVTTAGSEAIIFALMACTDPGDEIITFEPFYANYAGFSVMSGIQLIPVTSRIEDGFALPSIDQVAAKITSRTRAILICNPNNPTGYVYSREELGQLGDLARKHNLFIVADEVYREFTYDGTSHTSVLQIPELQDYAIMVDSISKRYNACGARVGCIASRRNELMDLVNRFAQARLCPPAIAQKLALAALKLPAAYLEEAKQEYLRRRDAVYSCLEKMDDVMYKPSPGAFYTVVQLPLNNTEDFARWLLTDFSHEGETVMLAPAQGFYCTPEIGLQQVRIAYVLQPERMKRSMELMNIALKEYRTKQPVVYGADNG